VGELKGGSRTDTKEWGLDRGFGGRVSIDDIDDPSMNSCETVRQRHALGQSDFAACNQLGVVRGADDDRPPGDAGSRIDSQNSPAVPQDAASETASSSNDRFA